MKEEKEEFMKLVDDTMSKFFEFELNRAIEDGDIDEDRVEIVREKFRLDKGIAMAHKKLDDVTHNDYREIALIMNELRVGELKLYEETYEKCKKWLDDNNMPYDNSKDDDEDND
jgi:hypothetical protein